MKDCFKYIMVGICFVIFHKAAFATSEIDCSNENALYSTQNPYGNIYHEGVTDEMTHKLLQMCHQTDYYYRSYWNMWSRQGMVTGSYSGRYLSGIFPVYSPISHTPILLQEVENRDGKYFQMISKTPAALLSVKDDCQQPRLSNGWMNLQCESKTYWSENRRNIYLLSKKEPYSSAPQIQFYKYHDGLLLVARNAHGTITHYSYEKYSLAKKTVRSFLGKKWNHP